MSKEPTKLPTIQIDEVMYGDNIRTRGSNCLEMSGTHELTQAVSRTKDSLSCYVTHALRQGKLAQESKITSVPEHSK